MRTDIVKVGLLASISFSMACGFNQASHEKAPFGATVTVPNDMLIAWNVADNTQNYSGLVVPFTVGVSNADNSTGASLPLPNIEVTITTSYGGVYLIPQEAIVAVGYPTLPDGILGPDDVDAYCSDEEGNFLAVEEWCSWYWDTETSQFYQFNDGYAAAFEENADDGTYYAFSPTMMVTETNNMGIVEAFMFIDAMPVTDDEEPAILDVAITAGITWDAQPFYITTAVE